MDESVIGAERRGWAVGAQGSWPARAGELRGMRAVLRSWLSPLCLDPVTVDRVAMAAHEAACNAVEHAYSPAGGDDGVGATVDITLHTERATVCVEITDHGTWREPAAQPIGRGLGIPLMQRLVASVLIQTDGRGTRVLLRHPIAASPSNLRSIAQGLLKPEERACAMSSAGPGLVVELVRRDPEGCVLAVSGELSVPSPGLLTRSLSKALADPGRVLVDVSRLRLGSAAAVQVFASALAGAGGWPATRLVLFGAGAELARTLTALRVTSTVPLAADEPAARLLLDRRPPVLARHLDLDRDSFSLRRARMFVRFACADWQLDPIRADAVAVASELVANALQHAGPACRLALRYRADALTIAVYDHNLTPVFPLRSVAEGHRGGGPSLLARRGANWGVRNGPQERCVWVVLPTSASADYVHTVRAAAQDAARAVLARGADSLDAAGAVEELLASLAAQHGRGFIQEVVDELAAELAEATAATAPSGPPDRAPTDPPCPPG